MIMDKKRIIIVDDEVHLLSAIKRALRALPYEVTYFFDADEARLFVDENPVDIIISDQQMPGGSGLDLILYAKNKQPLVSSILMSGYTDFDVVVSAINDGEITNYLTKPFDTQSLISMIDQGIKIKRDKEELLRIKNERILNGYNQISNSEYERIKTIEVISKALGKLIQSKDTELYEHSQRVAQIAVSIANRMKLSENEKNLLNYAAILHDLGKISLRDNVVYKGGKLTDIEYKEMKKHPEVGADILRALGISGTFVAIIEQHHERVDGNGYPSGLKGDEIELCAKILSVADAFDAMTADRVYRKGLSIDETLDIIIKATGSIYDGEVVKVLIEEVESKKLNAI